jgi:hypothetical protein
MPKRVSTLEANKNSLVHLYLVGGGVQLDQIGSTGSAQICKVLEALSVFLSQHQEPIGQHSP